MDDGPSEVECVRVVVRVRPRNEREEQQECDATSPSSFHAFKVDNSIGQVYVCKKKSESEVDRELFCNYDRVFDQSASQQNVFEYLQDSVQQVAQGFNCTIFAYGQTGTDKTHTMLGKDVEKHIESLSSSGASSAISSATATNRDNWGVIPRAIESLFEELRAISRHGAAAIVYCSYMQIYNNEVFDLLQENKQRMKDPLAVREMIKGNGKQIYVSGLSEFRVANLDETLKLLKMGNRNRTIRATEYNEKSSRSHALLQISAEVESRGVEGATTVIRRAKLNLVDLAGSEKWSIDAVMGAERTKELTAINQSLSALGNVISALTNSKRTHIPYRDSKLTRLLQDSLGGNTRTVVIATISPSETALDETISTLMFADRAKCVMVRVKVNEMVDDAILLARAQREIVRLKVLLKQNASQQQVTELEEQVARLTKENAALVLENKRLRKKMAESGNQSGAATTGPGVGNIANADAGRLEPSTVSRVRDIPETFLASSDRHVQPTAKIQTPAQTCTHKSGSLQLNKLRLDLMGSTTAPTTVDADGKPKMKAVFLADDAEDDVQARLNSVEKEHERLLRDIQTERRDLEQKLKLLSQQQQNMTPRQQPITVDPASTSDEESCPMCGRMIDDHSDEALDICIEKEEMEMQSKQQQHLSKPAAPRTTGATGDGSQHKDSAGNLLGPQAAAIPEPRNPKSNEATTATTTITPRRVSHSANGGRPSPYLQDLGLKPSTPSTLPSKSKPFANRRSLREGGTSNAVAPGAVKGSGSSARSRNATSTNAGESSRSSQQSNQTESQSPSPPENEIPILRQGHKSVKALKKFHAMSPYNLKLLKRSSAEKKQSGSSSSATTSSEAKGESQHRSEENPNSPTTPESGSSTAEKPDITIKNSVRDIGLKLTVYKFRYDCWYPCIVVGYDGKRKLHCCQFEYGDKQWQDLKERKVQVVGRVGDSSDNDDDN